MIELSEYTRIALMNPPGFDPLSGVPVFLFSFRLHSTLLFPVQCLGVCSLTNRETLQVLGSELGLNVHLLPSFTLWDLNP